MAGTNYDILVDGIVYSPKTKPKSRPKTTSQKKTPRKPETKGVASLLPLVLIGSFFIMLVWNNVSNTETTVNMSMAGTQPSTTITTTGNHIKHTRAEVKLSNYAERLDSPLQSISILSVTDTSHVGILVFRVERKDVYSLNKKLKSTIKKIGR